MMKPITRCALLVIPLICSMADACPMCRDSVAIAGGGGVHAPGGLFNASVLCILGAFLVVAGLLLAKIVTAVRLLDRLPKKDGRTA
jgi:hypothetical protein